jgi:hypothetical protein
LLKIVSPAFRAASFINGFSHSVEKSPLEALHPPYQAKHRIQRQQDRVQHQDEVYAVVIPIDDESNIAANGSGIVFIQTSPRRVQKPNGLQLQLSSELSPGELACFDQSSITADTKMLELRR